jgi:hypothetical protein
MLIQSIGSIYMRLCMQVIWGALFIREWGRLTKMEADTYTKPLSR